MAHWRIFETMQVFVHSHVVQVPNQHASLVCITTLQTWLHTCTQFSTLSQTSVAKAMQILLCVAKKYLSTCLGALCFFLVPWMGNSTFS